MIESRRHDEEAYQNMRTLEALTKVDKGIARLYSVLRILNRIRLNAPALWEQILKFVRENPL
jgi:hypothetical protein